MARGMSTSLFDELNKLIADDGAQAEYQHELAISAFTNSLARIMAEQRVSQAELARRLGVSRARVSQIMQHRCSPTLRTMVQLSSALGCDLTVAITPGVDPVEVRSPRSPAVSRRSP